MVRTAQEAIPGVFEQIEAMSSELPTSISEVAGRMLDSALKNLENDKPEKASLKLEILVKQIEKKKGKKIDPAIADTLLELINGLIQAI